MRSQRRGLRALLVLGALIGPLASVPHSVEAQFIWRDFVITGGASAEGYQGNLPAVSVPVQDSTDVASALIGEVGVRGDAAYRWERHGTAFVVFDGGMRQLAARGFELNDYAPREWVGTLDLGYTRSLGQRIGVQVRTRLRGRDVEDRPPMPLFLQPGYRSAEGVVAANILGPRDVIYDVEVQMGRSDFLAPSYAQQIRLLNREAAGVELGATVTDGGRSTLRLFGAVEAGRYPQQTTFDPADPYRRDHTFRGGGTWTYESEILVQIALEGRANRSNSHRPEFDAVVARALVSASLPREFSFTAYGVVTAKQYLHPSDFARLLPGEEANNASLAYVSLTRGIARNLDGTVRIGWTRAETEIGDAYFQRFGGAFLMHFRPGF